MSTDNSKFGVESQDTEKKVLRFTFSIFEGQKYLIAGRQKVLNIIFEKISKHVNTSSHYLQRVVALVLYEFSKLIFKTGGIKNDMFLDKI